MALWNMPSTKLSTHQWDEVDFFYSFVTLGKIQLKVKIEVEKHIYIIPAKHSYHYLSSIVMVQW